MNLFNKTLAVAALSVFLAPAPAEAYDYQIEIKEQAVDKLLDEVGTLSGQTGIITVWLDLWFTKIKLAQGPVFWTISNLDIDITSAGITLTGDVDASYDGFDVSGGTAVANATLSYDNNQGVVLIDIGSTTVPFTVDGGIWGDFSQTVTVNPNQQIKYALGGMKVLHPKFGGGLATIKMGAATLIPVLQQEKIVLEGTVMSW